MAGGRENNQPERSQERSCRGHSSAPHIKLTFGVADTNLLNRFDQIRHDNGDHLSAERVHASAVLLDLLGDRLDST